MAGQTSRSRGGDHESTAKRGVRGDMGSGRAARMAGLQTMPSRAVTNQLMSETDAMQKRLTELRLVMNEHRKQYVSFMTKRWKCKV